MHSQSTSLAQAFDRGPNNFNAIRLIAACLVIYGHAGAVTRGGGPDFVTRALGYSFTGGLAVDAFFLISGFLVTSSVMKGDIPLYIASRGLRILPALWICLAITSFILAPLIFTGDAFSWPAARDYFFHLALLWRYELFLPGVLAENRDHALNGVLWSVLLEARLYIAVLVLHILGIFRRKNVFNVLFFIAVILLFLGGLSPAQATLPAEHRAMFFFAFGAFFWLNRESIQLSSMGALIALMIAALFHGTPKFEIAYIFSFSYLVFACAFGPKWYWPQWMGDYSYGVYLWGWPIQQIIQIPFESMSQTTNRLVAIPLAVCVGALSWYFVEKPALSRKRQLAAVFKRLLPAHPFKLRKSTSS